MTEQELYALYSGWTGKLHYWCVRHLGRRCDFEYFPNEWLMNVYGGEGVQELPVGMGVTVPMLERPQGQHVGTLKLLRPEDAPSQSDLDQLFHRLCWCAAEVLEIDVGSKKLEDKAHDGEDKPKRRKRLRKNT
jgi:hypothetical protein